MNTRAARRREARAREKRRAQRKADRSLLAWLLFLLPLVAIALFVASNRGGGPDEGAGGQAPTFTLPTTLGTVIDLDEVLTDRDALLYFSMGVGCDGCFAQIPEIAEELEALDIALVSVMVDPAEAVHHEAQRFGIAGPIAIDADRHVSEAYSMLGVYGHSDRPSHSFALVRQDRTIEKVQHYAEMFVPAEALLRDLGLG